MDFVENILAIILLASWQIILKTEGAIRCYECQASTRECNEQRPVTWCPDDKPYCMFSWNRRTGMSAQGCADQDLCGNPRTKRDLYYAYNRESHFDAIPNTDELINCCNYDFCNCIGSQCHPISQASIVESSSIRLSITIALFQQILLLWQE